MVSNIASEKACNASIFKAFPSEILFILYGTFLYLSYSAYKLRALPYVASMGLLQLRMYYYSLKSRLTQIAMVVRAHTEPACIYNKMFS